MFHMHDPLAALYLAVIQSPEDHTVRLAYADALDEMGNGSNTARAEFIRSQITQATLPQEAPPHAELRDRCRKLFEEHWQTWWLPVCESAGLPLPQPESRHNGDQGEEPHGDTRPAGWPYTPDNAEPTTLNLAGTGLSFRFVAGFPEEVRFRTFESPDDCPALVHRWGDAMPLVRLRFQSRPTPVDWQAIDGPHLKQLASLTFERLPPETATCVAGSRNLHSLKHLSIHLNGADSTAIRMIAQSRVQDRLQSLHFTNRLPPAAIHELAVHCRACRLEELDLALGTPTERGGAMGQLVTDVIQVLGRVLSFPTARTDWQEYGPALETLAAAPWLRTIRRLRVTLGGFQQMFGPIGNLLHGTEEHEANLIPDSAFIALLNGLNIHLLERLVLPGAVMRRSLREEIGSRLGDRVTFG
jgi:uncharacterized protein (TIGR02996 family)